MQNKNVFRVCIFLFVWERELVYWTCVCICGYRYLGSARWQQTLSTRRVFVQMCEKLSDLTVYQYWATACVSLCKDVRQVSACMLIISPVFQCLVLVKASLLPLSKRERSWNRRTENERQKNTKAEGEERVCGRCNGGRVKTERQKCGTRETGSVSNLCQCSVQGTDSGCSTSSSGQAPGSLCW